MEYRNLGNSGCRSRPSGSAATTSACASTPTQTKAVVDKAHRARHQLLRHRRHLRRRAASRRSSSAQALQGPPPRRRHRHEVRRADGRRARSGRGALAPLHHRGRRRQPAPPRAPTTSTSTRCTSPTRRRRSKRRCARSTTSCARARCATSAAPTSPAGRSSRRSGSRAAQHLTPFVSAQNQYNLLDRRIERELAPACEKYGLGILPYFPLASGFLTGKYRPARSRRRARASRRGAPRGERMLSEPNFDVLDEARRRSPQQRGHTMIELAIGWLASHGYVPSVIAGATKPEQVEQNVERRRTGSSRARRWPRSTRSPSAGTSGRRSTAQLRPSVRAKGCAALRSLPRGRGSASRNSPGCVRM